MKSGVYKIVFTKSAFELNDDYEYLSDVDKERIYDLDADSFFDYEDGCYNCFVITTPIEIEKYKDILKSNFIENECIDISNDILRFKIDLGKELKDNISGLNSVKWGFFMDDLNDWILDNLDIDIVLDRISEVGINSLSGIEKDFLKNYKND
jgi:hypothetical protein